MEASAKEVSKMSILLKALVMMKRLARAAAKLVLLLRKAKARTRKKTGSWFSVLVAFENASHDPIDFWRTTVAT